ncbi:hypothetical protein MNEG_15627 [Monoraphidium neglectum]|uniref:Uncharacterized protein n=1 Tax=Monoraphidium neglectum TaxID=145388 RepID=A0A0D2LQW8_9CHLO|nr:hypothetical protein MNEG_15627 [Monoraphidium neglectum]KIY92336.1 hypothetical protein MNEG_15627 [Monoraphidium neglectum]|eukprot:XP_013891356.1 hypothetical protein MNEG_15627 [Monoraphidium neglectum]
MSQQHSLKPSELIDLLLEAARGGAPLDWPKLAFEAERFASDDGSVPASEVAAAVDAWLAANPGAPPNRDGTPRRKLIREGLLAHPQLGPRLRAAEEAEGGGGLSGTYALISLALGARAAGVRLH